MKKALIVSFAALVFGLSAAANAASWTLISDESRVSFVSVKAETVGEIHYFTDLDGSVTETGDVIISLPLESVETGIDVRNDRMREFLFDVVEFPTAIIRASVNIDEYETMAVGARSLITISAQLDLHGIVSDFEFEAFLTRVSESKITLDTAAPILIDADEFELGSGLDKLKALAGLDSISPIVPVTASLVFSQ